MTLDEAIKHAEEVMIENLEKTKGRNAGDSIAINCFECADDHRQLAEWLKDYKRLLEQEPKTGHWIENTAEYYKAINEKGGGVNEDTDYFIDDIACSECLAKFSVIDNEAERFDFCPNCGAKMVEPQEGEE